MQKDNVKYFKGSDNYTAYRCECGYKTMIKDGEPKVCASCGKDLKGGE